MLRASQGILGYIGSLKQPRLQLTLQRHCIGIKLRLLAPVGHTSAVPFLCLRKYAGLVAAKWKRSEKVPILITHIWDLSEFWWLVVPHRRIEACEFLGRGRLFTVQLAGLGIWFYVNRKK
jgi:hypothetical protein